MGFSRSINTAWDGREVSTGSLSIAVERDTRAWLERAVIGLNLCPFAKAVFVKGLIHYSVMEGADPGFLMEALEHELRALQAADIGVRETTLFVVPNGLQDFLDFNDFVGMAESLLGRMRLRGVIQIAGFHPEYRFAGAAADDITNFTNRSPYPTLHLLREASVDRAVTSFPESDAIYEANIATLRRMGLEGWKSLDVGPTS